MDGVPWYVNLMMSWLPFLVLIGTGIYVARSFGRPFWTRDGRRFAQIMDDYVRELRRSNDLHEESVKGQRRQLDAPER